MGADINAATGREHTSIYSRMLEGYLPRAVEITVDMARNSVVDQAELDSERQVVLEEINMHNDSPDEMVHDYLANALWGEHPIGHSVLGDADVIKTVDSEALQRFYRSHYVGSRIVVSAAGAVDHQGLCEMLAAADGGNTSRRARRPRRFAAGAPLGDSGPQEGHRAGSHRSRLQGPAPQTPRPFRHVGARQYPGRQHELQAVPEGEGAAGSGVLDLFVQRPVPGHGHGWHLLRHPSRARPRK